MPATLTAALLSGCSILQPPIEVSKRYERIEAGSVDCLSSETDNKDYCYTATVSALPSSISDPEMPINSLSDRAQEAYVNAIAALAKDPSSLNAALASPMKPTAASTGLYQDRSSLKLRFVVGLAAKNGYLYPGDRLTWAKLTIKPLGQTGARARFTGWSQAANAYEVIDVGTVTATRNETVSAETGLKIAKFAPDMKASAEASTSVEEKADIKDRVTISAMIKEGDATIIQTGGWRRDLSGNSTFDATIALSPADTQLQDYTTTSKLKTGDVWAKASEMRLGLRSIRIPKRAPVCAMVSLEFVARRVLSGDRSFSESNDKVRAVRGKTEDIQNIAQMPIAERWMITMPFSNGNGTGSLPLQFTGVGVPSHVLTFSTKNDAMSFIQWMSEVKATGDVGNGTLWFEQGKAIPAQAYAEMDGVNPYASQDWASATAPCPSAG